MTIFSACILTVLVAAGLQSMLRPSRAAATVYPVRFNDEPPPRVVDPAGQGQILDRYTNLVEGIEIGTTLHVLSKATLVERCGDGDGCDLRMFLFDSDSGLGSQIPVGVGAGLLWLDDTGDNWKFFNQNGSTSSGSLENTIIQSVLDLTSGTVKCDLTEGILGTYQLQGIRFTPDPAAAICLLQVGD